MQIHRDGRPERGQNEVQNEVPRQHFQRNKSWRPQVRYFKGNTTGGPGDHVSRKAACEWNCFTDCWGSACWKFLFEIRTRKSIFGGPGTTAPGKQPANGIASQIAGAQLAGGFLLKVILGNQFSAALATTAPGQQPAI